MRITNILILLFLMSAFGIGIALEGTDNSLVDSSINNVSSIITNITLTSPSDSSIPNIEGFYKIIEQGVRFVGILALEVLRTGVHFGKDNPQYFTPEYIFKIIKLIIWLVIVSLLIKPLFYVIIIILMSIIWINDKIKSRTKKEHKKKNEKTNRKTKEGI